MQYFKVRNLEKFQHYHDRAMVWIKLHATVLDDYEFQRLSDAERSHLILIWVLAAKQQNRLPLDGEWLARRLNTTEKVNLARLVQYGFLEIVAGEEVTESASAVLAPCYQDASLEEKRGDKKRKEEKRKEKDGGADAPRADVPENDSVVKEYGRAMGLSANECEKFYDHFTANGWKQGKGGIAIRDWKAALRNWKRRVQEFSDSVVPGGAHARGDPQRVEIEGPHFAGFQSYLTKQGRKHSEHWNVEKQDGKTAVVGEGMREFWTSYLKTVPKWQK